MGNLNIYLWNGWNSLIVFNDTLIFKFYFVKFASYLIFFLNVYQYNSWNLWLYISYDSEILSFYSKK